MGDPRLRALRDRISVETVPGTPSTRAAVVIETRGRRVDAEVDTGVPASDLGAQRERLRRKFLTLATPVVGRKGAVRLADAALAADELPSAAGLIRLAQPQ